MESFTIPLWRQCALAVEIAAGISLMLAAAAGTGKGGKKVIETVISYFFSFSPVALLIYMLYKVSGMH